MFYGNPEGINNMRSSLFLTILISMMLWMEAGRTQPLGYCPKGAPKVCRNSLPQAVQILTNCELTSSPDIMACGYTFVETLSAADSNAPYYIGFYEKKFDVGNKVSYQNTLASLKETNPEAIQVLYRLSKAIVLQYVDLKALSEEKKRELENMIQNVFRAIENVDFSLSNPDNRADFITQAVRDAQQINWSEI